MPIFRELTNEENWVREYEYLVNYICEGYKEIIYEYTNDLACRLFIQEAIEQNNEKVLSMEERIKKADEKFQSVLHKTKMCIHGNYPESYFWFWSIPKNSIELMNEAEIRNWL